MLSSSASLPNAIHSNSLRCLSATIARLLQSHNPPLFLASHFHAVKDNAAVAKHNAATAAARRGRGSTAADVNEQASNATLNDVLQVPPWRRINWGWLVSGVNNEQSLPREVIFNPLLRQQECPPIEEQAQLRSTVLFNKTLVDVDQTAMLNLKVSFGSSMSPPLHLLLLALSLQQQCLR